MPRDASLSELFSIERRGANKCHRPNHARKERIQVHYIALYFTEEFPFSTLKCHLSFGFTVPREKHSPILENHNGGTLPRPGIDVSNVL